MNEKRISDSGRADFTPCCEKAAG